MEEIAAFIQQRRSTGQPDQDISNELMSAGWDMQMVQSSFQALSTQSQFTPQQTVPPPVQPARQALPSSAPLQQRNPLPSQGAGPPNRNPSRRTVYVFASSLVIFFILAIIGFLLFSSPKTDVNPGTQSQAEGAELAQRDTQRRGDAVRLLAEAEAIASVNVGRFPEANVDGWDLLIGNFRDFNDPLTEKTYVFTTATPQSGQMQYANRVICNEDSLAVGTERSVVIRVLLESGELYCQDNAGF